LVRPTPRRGRRSLRSKRARAAAAGRQGVKCFQGSPERYDCEERVSARGAV
jgi:hypothetical protein